jgi:putative salt-induced outer membrane protein YdiY
MKSLFIIIVSISVIIGDIDAQIMNIENSRIKNDTTGWAGSLEMSFQYIKNTKELLTAGSKIHVQFKTKRSLYLWLTNYNLAKSGSTAIADAGSQHLRYNYKIMPWLTAEVFTQIQYNNLLNIKLRWLLGSGPRFKMIKTPGFALYSAVLYMYEYEDLINPDLMNHDHRISSYISFTLKLKDNLSIINTTYYQPELNDFSDFRLAAYTDLKIKISKHFAFKLTHIYTYDSDPAATIPKSTHALSNTFSYEF